MGEVFRGRDTRLGRDVAIKILPAGFAQSEQFRARFERGAKTISSTFPTRLASGRALAKAASLAPGAPMAARSTMPSLPTR